MTTLINCKKCGKYTGGGDYCTMCSSGDGWWGSTGNFD